MNKLILSLLVGLLISFSANAQPGLRCTLVDDFDDWAIEVAGDQVAFFDNDTVVYGTYKYSLEFSTDVYQSDSIEDNFVVEVNRYRPTLVVPSARLILMNDPRTIEAHDFVCFPTTDFLFF